MASASSVLGLPARVSVGSGGGCTYPVTGSGSPVHSARFHDLRHTHASLLLAAGVPVKDVSERIGHASAAMTLDVYGHVLAGHGQRTAAAWAGIMGAGSGGGIAAE